MYYARVRDFLLDRVERTNCGLRFCSQNQFSGISINLEEGGGRAGGARGDGQRRRRGGAADTTCMMEERGGERGGRRRRGDGERSPRALGWRGRNLKEIEKCI